LNVSPRVKLTFVTGNAGKVHEAATALKPVGIDVVGRDLHPVEIQGETLEEISCAKCEVLTGRLEAPFIVDDGGLFVDALKGFPGVFSAHALKTIGVPGILRLMDGVEDRRAHFAAVVSLYDGRAIHPFAGRCDGRLADTPRSTGHGFGFDPIFIPDGETQTFAELPAEKKNTLSHRGRALAQLVAHLQGTPR
jgi:XTP/dITP diphosphohydrolase